MDALKLCLCISPRQNCFPAPLTVHPEAGRLAPILFALTVQAPPPLLSTRRYPHAADRRRIVISQRFEAFGQRADEFHRQAVATNSTRVSQILHYRSCVETMQHFLKYHSDIAAIAGGTGTIGRPPIEIAAAVGR